MAIQEIPSNGAEGINRHEQTHTSHHCRLSSGVCIHAWDPPTYRFLSRQGDERLDLTTAEWLIKYGDRIVGGGPAVVSRSGQPLVSLPATTQNIETSILDRNGQSETWDWEASRHPGDELFPAGMVDQIDLEIHVPPTFPEKYRDSLIRSAELCKVKKHMEQPPRFLITTRVAEIHSLN